MKIKTSHFVIEFEIIFLIVFFSFILSNEIRKILFSFYICYLFIIFHELSHMLIASIFSKEIQLFKFSLAGVNICFCNNKEINKYKEILIYLAGPISNIILALLFSYNNMIFDINISLAIINLMPIFPLDGYNILYHFFRNTKIERNSKIILNYISTFILFILGILSIIVLLMYNNISIFIFFIYILLIYLTNKNNIKMFKKW